MTDREHQRTAVSRQPGEGETHPDTHLDEHYAALKRCEAQEPGPFFVERVTAAAVLAREEQEDLTGWHRWLLVLTRPRVLRLRVSPTLLLLAATVTGLAFAVADMQSPPDGAAGVAPLTASNAVSDATEASESDEFRSQSYRFLFAHHGAQRVAVAGDFNGWDADANQLVDVNRDGVFVATMRLERGSYAYMFVVDGEEWVPDPNATNYRPDGFGNRNAVIRID
jgi:hypothetical protein